MREGGMRNMPGERENTFDCATRMPDGRLPGRRLPDDHFSGGRRADARQAEDRLTDERLTDERPPDGGLAAAHLPTPETVGFRRMTLEDIDTIVDIEKECFTVPWTRDAFYNELMYNQFAHYFVMLWQGDIIGYGGLWTIVDEAHVTNIGLRRAYRGRKLGERLLAELVAFASSRGMKRMTLEVRISNVPAQRLYEKFGFRVEGVRRGYYSDNGEDALIMWTDLPACGMPSATRPDGQKG